MKRQAVRECIFSQRKQKQGSDQWGNHRVAELVKKPLARPQGVLAREATNSTSTYNQL